MVATNCIRADCPATLIHEGITTQTVMFNHGKAHLSSPLIIIFTKLTMPLPCTRHPNCPVFKHTVFKSPLWAEYKAEVMRVVEEAKAVKAPPTIQELMPEVRTSLLGMNPCS